MPVMRNMILYNKMRAGKYLEGTQIHGDNLLNGWADCTCTVKPLLSDRSREMSKVVFERGGLFRRGWGSE